LIKWPAAASSNVVSGISCSGWRTGLITKLHNNESEIHHQQNPLLRRERRLHRARDSEDARLVSLCGKRWVSPHIHGALRPQGSSYSPL
jgi:hypothetical protein